MANFDVTGVPPSSKEIARGARLEFLIAASCMASFLGVIGGVITAIVTDNPAAFGISLFLCFVLMVSRVCRNGLDFDELPEAECGKLLALCEKTPEGRQYRKAVLEQGRKFVCEELSMMERWVEGVAHRASCKQLYGIAVDDASSVEPS